MLVRFAAKNFLSFDGWATLSMQAASIREYRVENIRRSPDGLEVLKSNVLFGHNGSGKTNLIKALDALQSLVLNSASESFMESARQYQPYLLNELGPQLPCHFKIEFLHLGRHLRYEIAFNRSLILSESLTEILTRSEKDLMVRTAEGFAFAKQYRKDAIMRVPFILPNEPALYKLAYLRTEWAIEILTWFRNLVIHFDLDSHDAIQNSAGLLSQKEHNKMLLAFLQNAKLGFSSVSIDRDAAKPNLSGSISGFVDRIAASDPPKAYYLIGTRHKVLRSDGSQVGEVEFDLMANESMGARKFFALMGPVAVALKNGHPLVIDEMDSHLSSFLINMILKLFNSTQFNTKGAQLIFSTQNTDVLEQNFDKAQESEVNFGYLRRDQISIFEKTDLGYSTIRSLHDIGIRSDASYRKQYLEGQFFKDKPPGTQLRLFEDF